MASYKIVSGKLDTTIEANESQEAVKKALNNWSKDCQSRRLGKTITVTNGQEEGRYFCTITMLNECNIPHLLDGNDIGCQNCNRQFCVVKN